MKTIKDTTYYPICVLSRTLIYINFFSKLSSDGSDWEIHTIPTSNYLFI